MKWFLRFLLWISVLAVPGYWLAAPYQRALLTAVGLALGLHVSGGLRPESVDLAATNSLVVFAALCLASTRAGWRSRLLGLVAGLAALIAIEWLVGLLSASAAMQALRAGASTDASSQTWTEIAQLQRWGAAPLLWLLLLGRSEIPGLAGPRARAVPGSRER